MNNEQVQLTITDGIAVVALNRPEKLNAINMPMFRALDHTIKALKKRRDVRAVIIAGNGSDFCTGIDLKTVMQSRRALVQLLWKIRFGKPNLAQRVCVGWRNLAVPVIAAIHGRCWGGGLQIALGADFRVATREASLAIMESKWGLIPDMGGTLALRENMALDKAMLLAMTADAITASEALQTGLITEIVLDPLVRAHELATHLAERSPDALAAIKTLYHASWLTNATAILRQETWQQLRVIFGRNRGIAVKRAKGGECEYRLR